MQGITSPAEFYFGFMFASITLWLTFILFSWLLCWVLGASVCFRVCSWKCIRDVVVKFDKGAMEAVSVGEVKLSFCNSLVKLALCFLYGVSVNLRVLICDLEVVMRSSAALICDELSLSSEFGYNGAVGMVIRNIEIVSGNVVMSLEEDSFPENKLSSTSAQDEVGMSTVASFSANKPHQLREKLAKYSMSFPEKVRLLNWKTELAISVSFGLPNLNVKCVNREHDLLVENNIRGIQLRIFKSKFAEDTWESTCLDVQMELNEIHLFREGESSILEIMKVDVASSIEIPFQVLLRLFVVVVVLVFHLPVRLVINISISKY
ncbi:unnamed protein product [Cochlearia groenlandica]